jgi:hypothetical protein
MMILIALIIKKKNIKIIKEKDVAEIKFGSMQKKTNPPLSKKILLNKKESKFEELVRQKIEKVTSSLEKKYLFPTAHPSWLKFFPNDFNKSAGITSSFCMELDGFCPELAIAFEAQGPLHSQWQEKVEDYKSYFRRIMMDKAKIGRCSEKNILLIIVDYRLPRHLISAYISSRIYDEVTKINSKIKSNFAIELLNKFKERPNPYVPPDEISASKYPIYRNFELEKELNLKDE